MDSLNIGFAITGSFCTFKKALALLKSLADDGHNLIPIMSVNASTIDTRFGIASDIVEQVEKICGKKIIDSIDKAEPIGPKNLLDILVIAPCTGNTLGKMANGITDTAVTMAAKSTLRNQRPVLLGVSTNDALGASSKNIGMLQNAKNVYFIPMRQDDPKEKPASMVADFSKTSDAIKSALESKQLQPMVF